ncbi:MAG: DUF4840 domain-containing protein [Muribaculaceae bacterium]|nr:DUF4840 domain-containing protein [Muribaculaceae bacterium]
MKTNITILSILLILLFTGCNKDEPKISAAQILQAIKEMQGSYSGDMDVSYYQGERLVKDVPCTMESTDSLITYIDLEPMAMTIADENIAAVLRGAGIVSVKAGYEFDQMEDGIYCFILHPKDVVIQTTNTSENSIRIAFAKNFGGSISFLMPEASFTFNLSPSELWVGNKKYDDFKQMVFNCGGVRQ